MAQDYIRKRGRAIWHHPGEAGRLCFGFTEEVSVCLGQRSAVGVGGTLGVAQEGVCFRQDCAPCWVPMSPAGARSGLLLQKALSQDNLLYSQPPHFTDEHTEADCLGPQAQCFPRTLEVLWLVHS